MSIDLECEGSIATITFDQPEKLNALDSESLGELLEVITDVARDRSIRAIILTGAGDRAFVAGADIQQMATFTIDYATVFARLGHAVTSALELAPQPVIAAVNGYALGGGCEICLACDIRLASTTAVFGQPETGLGIPPGWGGTQRLPRLVGPGIAAEMIYAGMRLNADEAWRVGLVNALHEPGDLMDRARAMARSIAGMSPAAVRASKRLIARAGEGNPAGGLAEEARAFAEVFGSANQREGMSAFLDKRTPGFEDESDA